MKFRAFIGRTAEDAHWFKSTQALESSWKWVRIVAVVRGSEVVRHHVLDLLKKGLTPSSTVVFHYNDVKDSLWKLLSSNAYDLRILFWEKNSMNDDEVDKFLSDLSVMDGMTIILDASEQIYKGFQRKRQQKTYSAPWMKGKFIDCSFVKMEVAKGERTTKKKLYTYWLKDAEKLNISPRLLEHLSECPILEVFNTINALKYVGERDYNLITAEKWGVLWVDREQEVMRKLLYKGRGAVKNIDWRDVNTGRFFWLLLREITLLLKVKTLYRSGGYSEPVIPRETYHRLKGEAGRFNLGQLYRRLFLVTSLMRWREHAGSLSLLILHW